MIPKLTPVACQRVRSTGGNVDPATGRRLPAVEDVQDFLASVRPASPEELARLTEGDRARRTVSVYSDDLSLEVVDALTGSRPDTIVITSGGFQGRWEVATVHDHSDGLWLRHWLAVCVWVQPGEVSP